MMRPQRHGSWSAQDDLKVGRYTVRLKRSLGEGGFAFIHLVEDVNTGRVLVLKRSSLQSHEGRVVYEKEASIMRSLAHPNIVQIVTAVELQSSKTGAILMEFCPRGHLLEALNSLGGKRMEEEAVLSVMCDIVSAVKYLHDKGITHRDMKLENILRSSSGLHKLCDFGSCVQGRVPLDTAEQRANEEEVVEKTTTQMYRAPEMVDLYLERELTERVDIWALGCILYAVCYLKNPFQDAGNLGILNAKIRIPDDSVFSSGLVDLIRRCLTASPTHRPSACEAGIHALSKGNPLPPPRHKKKSSEADCGHAAGTAAASVGGVAAQAATAPASNSGGLSNRVGTLARSNIVGGRGDEGSGRTVTAAGAAGKSNSQQVLTPPKAKPVAAQPQLNPNSVAARRLASRKGSASSNNTRSRNCLVPPPPPPPPPSEQRPDDDGGAPGGGGGSPTGWPGASTAAAAAATVASGACGGGGHPDPDGWSNFAAFDQFPEALDLSTSGRQQGCSNFGEAPFESPVAAVRESPQVMNVTPPVSEKRQSGGRRAVAGGVAALREQLEGASFMPPPPEQQQRQQQQQQHQQQQLVGKITPIGRAASLAGGGGNQQQAWLMAPPAGQAAPGVDRPLSGRVENVFPATFPRQASGGGGVASDASIGIGSSPQRRQQQQQQQQQPSRSPSPPLPPPQAVFLGGAATSPTQSMAFLSPSVGTAGSMQQQQGLGQVPQLQQQRQRSSAQQQQQQQQQQWPARNPPADVGEALGNNNASWTNGSSATWYAAERMMGRGVDGVSGSPPIAASLPIPTLRERESSSGRQQQHQKFGSIPPPTQPQFPGTGGPW